MDTNDGRTKEKAKEYETASSAHQIDEKQRHSGVEVPFIRKPNAGTIFVEIAPLMTDKYSFRRVIKVLLGEGVSVSRLKSMWA